MRRLGLVVVLLALGVGVYYYSRAGSGANNGVGTPGGGGRPTQLGDRGGRFGPRGPMTVELVTTSRADLAERITVVGNLIGAATVEVAPKVSGRLQAVHVRLGDRVAKGQAIAKVEDRELVEQVKQAEASFEVSSATIRQRETDLKLAQTSLDRAQSLFKRQLLPQQSLDDAQARYDAAVAQLDLARAQFNQSKARLDELRINLSNTVVVSPVDGFVGRRHLDPGAFASTNQPVVSVVDIHFVRLVVDLVERDLRKVAVGMPAEVEVDAFPGEKFTARVARVAPVLDPATRTAQMEIEVPNRAARLKPGMYARVRLTVEQREGALVIPLSALVTRGGQPGVFVAENNRARFKPVQTGLQDEQRVEVRAGLDEGDRIVTTGAGALTDGDQIVLAGGRRGRGGPGGGRRGRSADNGRPQPAR